VLEIVVCIKQVPDSSKMEVDETTSTLIREGAEMKINPFDLYAIETALRIREQKGGRITAISMGPQQAAQILREAFMMGVDRGILLCDPRLAGSDTLATAFAIACGIQQAVAKAQLLVCGKQTTDGDTAQVGPEIAEFLQIPHLCNVSGILELGENALVATVDLLDAVQTVRVEYPCLITVEKDIFPPRLPSFRKKSEAKSKPIEVLGCSDLMCEDLNRFGLDGSPTHVEKMFPPQNGKPHVRWTGTGAELAERMTEQIKHLKLRQSDDR
jgi:electron transfer flavoprotein beta subunit